MDLSIPSTVQPGMYPRLQQMVAHGPLGGLFARLAIQHQEQQRIAAGISPEDWQAKIDAHYGGPYQGVQHVPETTALAPVPVGFTGLGAPPQGMGSSNPGIKGPPVMRPMPQFGLNGGAAPSQDPVLQGDWLHHFVSMLSGGRLQGGALSGQSFGGF